MTPYNKRSCKITQRLAEDMLIRNLAPATIDAYTYHVRRFADFIQKPLDQVTREDVSLVGPVPTGRLSCFWPVGMYRPET